MNLMETFRPAYGNLFSVNNGSLGDYVMDKIKKTIEGLEDDYVLNVSEQDYISYLTEESLLCCPVVDYEGQCLDARKSMIPPQYQPISWSSQSAVARTVFQLQIPFLGDPFLLGFRPTTYNLSGWPNMSYNDSYIYVDIPDIEGNASDVRNRIQSYQSSLTKMMEYLSDDITRINEMIPEWVKGAFCSRKERLVEYNAELMEIGIPLVNASPKTYAVPTLTRKASVIKPAVQSAPGEMTPVMADQVYSDIVNSLSDYGRGMEKHPSSHVGKKEEDLRDLFLIHLKGTFRSLSATGESFNVKGKTDIMVQNDNTPLFIAECKMWKGQKMILSAIDQLIGYLSWRDTKTALIIFCRNAGFSSILSKLRSTLESHPCFDKIVAGDGARLECRFHFPSDSDSKFQMTVLTFDFSMGCETII